ncbi:N-acetylmuramoyl-L-alanine amidase [Megasphaera butyrica]|jgi:N-acetylmuramoyl-L-alanine amidase|uniref:N-acetylmuramoyl-L-alanine amidase family protein n=1 Tax=Megasphaera TaxID=906 RepID=UPI0008206131|nr:MULTISPECIES: N-acetylmuramoyl-L-alanine amidase [Megasphaera]MDN0047347.1 N-acetylmuramoyl-L-alanine amidase [Megasphaera hexanoica]SCJ47440.1 N-acetylmuramoyl-L-alanine amidase AmiC precursor [uncultured Ruminococcus sp.]MBM6733115.1 N-acetylmuramoyl-L-alanine amidase [Megasphaera stantonii]MCU6715003.1 N-acetylmuramoyl-L-alanine amidase [Megasphaera butyrica]NJE33725.1 N-acetylmuramoyl-L-alanine amidase [Megasphaera sp. SW808]
MKKLFILPLLMLLCLIPMLPAQAASKAEITSVRTATRNDANVPFVRTVLELDSKVTPRLFIDKDGKYVTVTLPNAKIAKNVEKKYNADRNVVSRISLSQRSSGTDVNIKVPRAVTKSDVNVFTLPGTDKAKKECRVVIDVNDKSGKVKQWMHWNDAKIGIDNTSLSSTYSVKVPSYSSSRSYKLTKGLKDKVICIDPGHGGTDVGAIGKISQEKNITLAISKKIADLLNDAGAKVIMTRTTDVDVYAPYDAAAEELQARCNIANAAKADAFVSVHIDSFSSADARGVTAYYNSKTPHDYSLAKYIHNQNMQATEFPDRGTRTANFYVLLHTNMPAVLLELGFISNPTEERALNSEKQQQNFAESIVKGLADYFNHNGR